MNGNQLFTQYGPLFVYHYMDRMFLDSETLYFLLKKSSTNELLDNKKTDNNLETRILHDKYDAITFLFFCISTICYIQMESQGDVFNGKIRSTGNLEAIYSTSLILAYLSSSIKKIHLIGKDIKSFWNSYHESKEVQQIAA